MAKSGPIDPISISIVGTGTGDGGGHAPTPDKTVAVTPENQPNLIVQVVSPLVALVVRFANAFFVTFLGLLTAAGIGQATFRAGSDFGEVVWGAALSSLIVAGFGAIKDCVTIFGRLEGKYPLRTGSI